MAYISFKFTPWLSHLCTSKAISNDGKQPKQSQACQYFNLSKNRENIECKRSQGTFNLKKIQAYNKLNHLGDIYLCLQKKVSTV